MLWVKIGLVIPFFLWVGFAFGQSGFVVFGVDQTAPSGEVSASVGQVFTSATTFADTLSIAGLQQPFEYLGYVGLPWLKQVANEVRVFPNPTRGATTISFSKKLISAAQLELYDSRGRLVLRELLDSQSTVLDLSGMAGATYTLQLVFDGQLAIFKISKL
jgi:hypothetical protein